MRVNYIKEETVKNVSLKLAKELYSAVCENMNCPVAGFARARLSEKITWSTFLQSFPPKYGLDGPIFLEDVCCDNFRIAITNKYADIVTEGLESEKV